MDKVASNVDPQVTAKAALRKEFMTARKERYAIKGKSWAHILECEEFENAKVVTSYISYGYEPELDDLNQEFLRRGVTLLMPRMLPDYDLEWVPWSNGAEIAANGRLSEPVGEAFADLSRIDICIVPALHIDGEGNRLGKGKGCYDRAIAKLESATSGAIFTIGIVHDGEITAPILPHEAHDHPLKAAATPTSLVRFS